MAQRSAGTKRSGRSGAGRSTRRTASSTDKSVQAFREALERSVTLSRDRIQEVADEAVRHGRMTRGDANELVSKLVSRGRKQTETMLRDLERVLRQARREAETRAAPARRRAERAAGRAARAARDAADQPLAQADRLRRRAGVGPTFPITAYDQLTAPQVRTRLTDLKAAELRRIRDYERRNKNRKGIITAIDQRIGGGSRSRRTAASRSRRTSRAGSGRSSGSRARSSR
jgi:polyhydroxyalkanoate synthesis regulator phasin